MKITLRDIVEHKSSFRGFLVVHIQLVSSKLMNRGLLISFSNSSVVGLKVLHQFQVGIVNLTSHD